MRQIINPQMSFGEQDISQIALDASSRDDIPRILRGLQYIYITPQVRERIFAILAEVLPVGCDADTKVSADLGRPGMEQWKILVLGTLRLSLNADYDRVLELSNQHVTIRQMLGHSDWVDDYRYKLQTIKDNVCLFTPELLERINQVVVDAGHALVRESPNEPLAVRIDSFVVETHVHFPTDANILLDAVRKVIATCAAHCEEQGLSDWRQSAYNQRCLKKAYRKVQRLKRSRSKDDEKRAEREGEILQAYQDYLDLAEGFLSRARETRDKLVISCRWPSILMEELDGWVGHAERQIDQISRRVFDGERIPHSEKVFSIFQPHTEWINKGKAGVPVELGLRVAVSEDQHGFILNHCVMEKITDDQVAIAMVQDLQARFSPVRSASLDKGFHSKENQAALAEIVPFPVMPKKGKRSQAELEREHDPEFIYLRHRHSAVESAINALEVHGLDMCPDHGIAGFKRYVALAVVGRNLHRLGAILLAQDAEQERRKRKRAA